jgi:hypothetical protein
MEIMVAMIAFLALVVSWFMLPSQPRTAEAKTPASEALPSAA